MKKDLLKFIVFIGVVLLFFLYTICLFLIYDPLQLFSEKYEDYYSNDLRISGKRIIDKNDFDSVIIGSSVLVNSNPKDLQDGKYINLSLTGSTIDERIMVLEYILKKKKVKNIIISLDGNWRRIYTNFEVYKIYNDLSTFQILLKYYSLVEKKCMFLPLKECKGVKVKDILDLIHIDYSTNYTLKNEDLQNKVFKRPLVDNYGYDELEKFIKNNPDINFHIIMPPYSTLYYINLIKLGDLVTSKELLISRYKTIIKNLNQFLNVKFYFFGNEDFINNLNNYSEDAYHYKAWINSRINKAINEGINIITVDNMDEEFDKFIKKVENYDIKAYEEALKLDIRE